jgi:hypothetical protein
MHGEPAAGAVDPFAEDKLFIQSDLTKNLESYIFGFAAFPAACHDDIA